ncbi:hypothetical protein [Actinoplanes sp. NPDC020271]|uniref:hypothetical protein n=1 Tax=Actinoplanes sp. NPDC020271 TaxID=3363896 RepID=UPI0037AF23D8
MREQSLEVGFPEVWFFVASEIEVPVRIVKLKGICDPDFLIKVVDGNRQVQPPASHLIAPGVDPNRRNA